MARVALDFVSPKQELSAFPPPDQWDDWMEYESKDWPKRVEKRYMLVPTVCFNCEAGCGLLAYIDKESGRIKKFEGNPYHPGSRGRNCAKGPATINQIKPIYVDFAVPEQSLMRVRDAANWRGSIYGWAMTMRKMALMMGKGMSKTLPGLQNFYMIGQWVEPSGNVQLSAASGRDLLEMICRADQKPFVTSLP